MPRVALGALFALAASIAACGGEGETDPLGRDTLLDLATDKGDATGSEHSGAYAVLTLDVSACDCPVVEFPLGEENPTAEEICAMVFAISDQDGSLNVVQADGTLAIPEWEPAMAGPVNADGTFSLGGVQSLDQVYGNGDVLARFDGAFDGDTMTAAVQQKFVGDDILGGRVECTATADLVASRAPE